MSKALDVLKFLAVGPYLRCSNFDFKVEQSSTKGKGMALPHKTEEHPGEASCWQLLPCCH